MNDAGPKKSPFGVNVTDWPSVVAAPADTAPTDVTVSPRPSGSMSLPRTGMVTAWPWFVVAWSPRAWGGGADGAVTVSDTVAVADSPAASVTVYWNESVVSVPSRGAVAWTSDPSEPVCCSATAPCAGAEIAVPRYPRLDGQRHVRGRRRPVRRRQHVDRDGAGDGVALLVVDGVGER